MLIGTIVHQAIERYWKDRTKAITYAYSCFDKELYNYKGLSKKDLDTVTSNIHSYFDNFSKFMTDKDEIEKRFKVKLYDDVYLVGKFDRISNGVIYDWKTSTKISRNLSNDPQFIVYYDAYKRIYGNPPNAIFLASLSKGELVPYEHNEFNYNQLYDDVIINLIKDIKNKNFIRDGMFRGICHSCSFKKDCLKGINEDVKLDSGNFAA